MIYLFFARRIGRPIDCTSDLEARKVAVALGNVTRVETQSGRVVWRKVYEPGNAERLPKTRQS